MDIVIPTFPLALLGIVAAACLFGLVVLAMVCSDETPKFRP